MHSDAYYWVEAYTRWLMTSTVVGCKSHLRGPAEL